MLKHIGRHNNRKIIVLYRQVPGEDHMCLVSYSDMLPKQLHDDIMKVLESPAGQQAKELADVLFRNMATDGRSILSILHKEGYIKKVQTNQVIITPTSTSSVRLDELNNILNEMAKGEDAVKKLSELDQQLGMTTKTKKGKESESTKTTSADVVETTTKPLIADQGGVLSDEAIAANMNSQAAKMLAEAKSLMAEAERLQKEAATLVKPVTESDVKPRTKTKKTTKVKEG
jgi:hypothetical protein